MREFLKKIVKILKPVLQITKLVKELIEIMW